MRASYQSAHVSGAERIADAADLQAIVQQLLARASQAIPEPDEIVLHCDRVAPEELHTLISLDLITIGSPDEERGRAAAVRVLERAGVPVARAAEAIRLLVSGASQSGKVMRGAALIDIRTGRRLEQDRERGIRASRFDWSDTAAREIDAKLKAIGLEHYRTREALALATKVASAPGVVAELCWSDDPSYTPGYVASRKTGYVRFPHLKRVGDPFGGRVIFIDPDHADPKNTIHYLQVAPVLINGTGICRGELPSEEHYHV